MDTQEMFELIDRFENSSLAELELDRGDDFHLYLKKAGIHTEHPHSNTAIHQYSVPTAHAGAPAAEVAGAGTGTSAAPGPGPDQPHTETSSEDIEVITSPIVGTFYRAPAPDSPPHAEEGDIIKTGAPLCIVEAMKVMNELEAEFDMEIEAVLAENGSLVEYGTPLFRVRRR